jgi:hypothetical protein
MSTGGLGYTAFVVDAYAGLIPGWECHAVRAPNALFAFVRNVTPTTDNIQTASHYLTRNTL